MSCSVSVADVGRVRPVAVRAACGPVRLVYSAGAGAPSVMFAIPKKTGTAVARNRIRRRLRAIFEQLSREDPSLLDDGRYLFRVSSPIDHLSHQELHGIVTDLLRNLSPA